MQSTIIGRAASAGTGAHDDAAVGAAADHRDEGDTHAASYSAPVRAYASLRATPTVFRPAGGAPPVRSEAPHAAGASSAAPFRTSPLGLAYDDVFNTMIASRTVVTSSLAAAGGVSATVPMLRRLVRHPIFERVYTDEERSRWLSTAVDAAARRAMQEHLARLIRAGGLVALGSAAPSVPYGLGVHLDMALLVGAGIAPDQVLRIATAGNALALGVERQLGTLEAGKLADFVVVEGDPLRDVADALDITAVVKGGVWLDREVLVRAGPAEQ